MQAATIGTAGPAGHGKTALVRALAGEDPAPRAEAALDAEHAAVHLGFSFKQIGGRRFGVVDLPGNERLVRGLLGDAHGIDLVLLAVAADEGVRPQTEECVDILHLLDVRDVVFVITRTDLVETARVDDVRAAIAQLAGSTSFAAAPVHAVSSTTGAGIDTLRAEVLRRTESRRERPADGWFRMFVDRSFYAPGRGLTVTGTVLAGRVGVGNAVVFRPGALGAEVSTIQVHGETVTGASTGERVAVRLGKLDRKHVKRGVVLADPRVEFTTDRFDCRLELRPGARLPLRSFDRVEIDIGTVETAGSVVVLEPGDVLAPRASGYCQIALEREMIVASGDRFVLRPEGGARTTGGGVVLHPFAVRHASSERGVLERLAKLQAPALAPRLLAFLELLPELAAPLGYAAQGLGRTTEEVRRVAGGIPDLVALPDTNEPHAYATRDKWDTLVAAVREALQRFHRAHPLEAGMDAEALRARLRVPVPPRLLADVVARLVAEAVVVRAGELLRLAKHRPQASAATAAPAPAAAAAPGDGATRVRRALASGGFTPPDRRQLEAVLRIPPERLAHLLGVLEREGAVVAISEDCVFDRDAYARARQLLLDFLADKPEITVADFRTLLDASRKYALALLEHFDREGLTVRVGDARRLA